MAREELGGGGSYIKKPKKPSLYSGLSNHINMTTGGMVQPAETVKQQVQKVQPKQQQHQKKQIDTNQYTYLNNLLKQGGGTAAWAKQQLANSNYVAPLQNNINMVTGGMVQPATSVKQAAQNVVDTSGAYKPKPQTSGIGLAMESIKANDFTKGAPIKPQPPGMSSSLQNHIKMTTGGMVDPASTVKEAVQNIQPDITPVLPVKPPFGMVPPAIEQQIAEQVKNPVTVVGGQVVPTTNDRQRWEAPVTSQTQTQPLSGTSAPSSYSGSISTSSPAATATTTSPTTTTTTTEPAPITTDGGTTSPEGAPAQMTPWDNPLIGEAIKLLQGDYSYLEEIANTQGAAAAEEARANLMKLIEQLKTNRDFDLREIEDNIKNARAGLEDSAFQQYLKTRQIMANRGLGGSGLHQGAETQLLLGNNRALAGLFQDAGTDIDRITAQYGMKINDAYDDMSGVNSAEMSADIFQKLRSEQQSNDLKRAELYAKIANQGYPYMFPTANNSQNAALDRWKWQTPSANNTQNNMTSWNKWITPSANAQLSAQTQVYVADLNNKTRLELGYANINAQMTRQANDIQMKALTLQNTQFNQQANHYKNIASQKLNEAKVYLDQINKGNTDPALQNAYSQAMTTANMASGALTDLVNGGPTRQSSGGGSLSTYDRY